MPLLTALVGSSATCHSQHYLVTVLDMLYHTTKIETDHSASGAFFSLSNEGKQCHTFSFTFPQVRMHILLGIIKGEVMANKHHC